MRSRSSPSNPFAAKIWRISSRSPSGTTLDVQLLLAAGAFALLALRARAEEVAGGHAEAVGDQVGAAEDDHDRLVEAGALHARDDRERRDRPVDGAVDEVVQVARRRLVAQPLAHRVRRVLLLEKVRLGARLPFTAVGD